jgi:hypothetical protein
MLRQALPQRQRVSYKPAKLIKETPERSGQTPPVL